MKKHIAVGLAAAACALATGAAQAGDVHWSIGINLPPIGTVISNAPVYHRPAPVYVAPPPVVYVPPPRVVYRPVPVVYAPPPPAYYYYPAPVVVHGKGYKHHHKAHWRDRNRDGRYDDYGYYRDGRWVRLDPRRHRHH